MTSLEHAKAMVDALARETAIPHNPRTFGVLADAQAALMWAVDEIEQAHDDRREATRVAIELSGQIADLEEQVQELTYAESFARVVL